MSPRQCNVPPSLQSLLCVLYQDVVLQYVKKMMKTRSKSREHQVAGAQRIIEDAQKMDKFFTEEVRRVLGLMGTMGWVMVVIMLRRFEEPSVLPRNMFFFFFLHVHSTLLQTKSTP